MSEQAKTVDTRDLPIREITDGWPLKCGCLYLLLDGGSVTIPTRLHPCTGTESRTYHQ